MEAMELALMEGGNMEEGNMEESDMEGSDMEESDMEGRKMEEGSLEESDMEGRNMEEERALMEEVDMEEANTEEDVTEKDVAEPGLTLLKSRMLLTSVTTMAANLRIQPSSRPSQEVVVEAMVVASEGATVLMDTAVRHMVEEVAVDAVLTELPIYE